MLAELRIHDLAIIDELNLAFGPGFNVLTGETGAGKSIIIDAVGLLLGDRASTDIVRAGAERTEVEGTFVLEAAAAARLAPILQENSLEGDQPEVVMLAREVRANGRSVGRVNGRAVTSSLLAEIGQLLLDVHGQGEHLSLLREREHVGLLDRYAGLDEDRAAVAELVRRLRGVRRDLEGLRQDERERARRIDLLSYQVEEIGSARLKAEEESELEIERRRLANAEQLAALSNEAVAILQEGGTEQVAALDALGTAQQALERLARIDPSVQPLADQVAEAAEVLTDLARELERYRDGVEFNPHRLEEVEERLQLIRSLQRKYGDSIEEVLAYGERAAAELETISHAEEHIADLEADESRLLAELGAAGAALSAARRAAGERMAAAIETELGDLQMTRARFAVQILWAADAAGAVVSTEAASAAGERAGRYAFDANGLDQVAFLVSANPGEPLKPLAKVASGGETSRLMLALKTVLGRADQTPTLIFDEIDMGIGGRVGGTVGQKLWSLTTTTDRGLRHQVLCITHLPQLAAYGDDHFHVAKRVVGDRTMTTVQCLTGDQRITELARMLGADSDAGRASVNEMMLDVETTKKKP
ncbi:MAG TPA: DNA repair protein RecN [Anaerolineae bacterium]